MFEQMNKHKYLSVLEISETAEQILRIVIAEAEVIEDSLPVTAEGEQNDALRALLNESKPIEVTKASCVYEVQFDDYVTYSVRNESYTSAGSDANYQGRHARIYTKSAFLDYIAASNFATADYPGPFQHFGFYCLDHVIDVAATESPRIRRLSE